MLQDVHEMLGSCSAATDILNDLLLYERLETSNVKLVMRRVPVKRFIEEKIEAFVLQARQKGVRLDLEFKGNNHSESVIRSMQIHCDEEMMRQVFRSLMSSAIDCTPAGGVVTVSVTFENQDRMFESALQFTAGVLQTREGKGLGLWSEYRLVK
eukprot:gene3930-7843_t